MTTRNPRQQTRTFAIAGAGAGAFWILGLPLPFLFGPMFACLAAALAGVELRRAGPVSTAARTLLGVAVGASVTPEVLERLPGFAASVAFIPLYIAVIAAVGVPYFHHVCRFDRVTAWYAAMPGGLQDMVLFGQEAGGNPRALSLIHATRVLVVVTIAPILMTRAFGQPLTNPIGAPAVDLPLGEIGLMAAAAVIGWKGGERIGLFGASIIGPLILTAILSLAGVIHSRPPAEAIIAAQFFIGMGIGVGYVGVTADELRRDVLAGVFFVVILAAIAAVFTEIVHILGLAGPVDGFLAFAPGGQAEMTVLAIVAGADLGYVIVHHLTRIVLVILGAPVAARFFRMGRGT